VTVLEPPPHDVWYASPAVVVAAHRRAPSALSCDTGWSSRQLRAIPWWRSLYKVQNERDQTTGALFYSQPPFDE
jgi:hypothetical protein